LIGLPAWVTERAEDERQLAMDVPPDSIRVRSKSLRARRWPARGASMWPAGNNLNVAMVED